MGRFSCFYGQVYNPKQKKPGQPSFETMVKMLQLGSPNVESENIVNPSTLHETRLLKNEASNLGSGAGNLTLASRSWTSGELNCDYDAVNNTDTVHYQSGKFRRSVSVGCELDQKERIFGGNIDDDGIPQDLSCDGSQLCADTGEISPTFGAKSLGTSLFDQHQLIYDVVNHASPFVVDNPHCLSKEGHAEPRLSSYTEYRDDSGHSSPIQSRLSKCYSMPNFGSMPTTSPSLPACDVHTCNSTFNVLSNKQENASAHEASVAEVAKINRVGSFYNPEKLNGENAVLDTYDDSYNYACSTKDWVVPMRNELDIMRHGRGNSSCDHWDHFTNKDFKIKQIEDWVIDLQHCSPLEETNQVADSSDEVKRGSALIDGLAKVEMKVNPGMEAAKRYISSLTATASSAQLANYGLVAIPLLSAFVSLKVLNLSGNSIGSENNCWCASSRTAYVKPIQKQDSYNRRLKGAHKASCI
ncbi:Leucine-rich repeat-containing protein 32 [Bienertia sinuspersici]